MKYALVIPTFKGHFKYIPTLLESYEKYVCDSDTTSINFIVSDNNEKVELSEIVKNYEIQNVFIYDIEKILQHYNITIKSSDLLSDVGRYSYQTIKKLYAIHYLQFEKFLILDSESLFCNKTNMSELFENYFKQPYVFYSKMPDDKEYKNWLDYKTTQNCCKLLNVQFNNKWLLEGFHWFYEKDIINDLFKYFDNNLFSSIYEFCKSKSEFDKAIFECILYYQYIYNHNEKYKYKFVNSHNELKSILGEKYYTKIRRKMHNVGLSFLPFTIHYIEYIRIKDLRNIFNFYNKYKVQNIRLGCDARIFNKLATIIIKQVNIKILCSTDRVNRFWQIIKLKNIIPTFLFTWLPILNSRSK